MQCVAGLIGGKEVVKDGIGGKYTSPPLYCLYSSTGAACDALAAEEVSVVSLAGVLPAAPPPQAASDPAIRRQELR